MIDRALPASAPETSGGSVRAAAVPFHMETLTQRSDFLRAARARRQGTSGLLLQARRRDPDEGPRDLVRVGYTCSKKIGNAVARNRAKRRLRALARDLIPELGQAGWDYVLVGKPGATTTRDFAALGNDLRYALRKIHGGAS